MGFYDNANAHLAELNEGERRIFQYVVRNVREVGDRSVRELASELSVSSTTIVRFAKRLGYSGWRELSLALRDSTTALERSSIAPVLLRDGYADDYLRNVVESARALTKRQVERIERALLAARKVYCFGEGADWDVSRYAYRMLMALGFDVVLVEDSFERAAVCRMASARDVALVFSLGGESRDTVSFVEGLRQAADLTVVSLTRSDNNTVQGLSDVNAFVFTDRVVVDGQDLSSRISMFVLMDLICYDVLRRRGSDADSPDAEE